MTTTQATALKAKVKQVATNTKTIRSGFTQSKHMSFLSNDIISKGQLAYKEPAMVKWQYSEPFSYAVVFKNKKLYINDEGKKSNIDLSGNALFTELNGLITASIRGDLFDTEKFEISYFNLDNASLVHFKPIDDQFAEFISVFHIEFNSKGEVSKIKMIEPSEDYTLIEFENRKTNIKLSDAEFSF